MKNLLVIVIAIVVVAAGAVAYQSIFPDTDFVIPVAASGSRTDDGISKHEFTELFDQDKPFSTLAQQDYYTVIEGYINTCSICKRLEADFGSFLDQRKDVLIKRVHMPEGGVSQSFNGSSQEEILRQIADYHDRLGRYKFFHVVKTGTAYHLTVCGTPHIEIYGPDKQLIATDRCGDTNLKTGLKFLRNWIKAERL